MRPYADIAKKRQRHAGIGLWLKETALEGTKLC